MKKIFLALSLLASMVVFAQAPEESRDVKTGTKVLKGFIAKEMLVSDTAFAWYGSGIKSFTPNAASLAAIAAHKNELYVLVFGGTWCEDTQQILPKMYATFQAAGLPEDHVTLLGVDREKKTIQHLSEIFGVTSVPTFIVLKNGKEVGRIIEYGPTGMPEREIGTIVNDAFKK
jgi:thiol-disulfide isomerase/thioredoxin